MRGGGHGSGEVEAPAEGSRRREDARRGSSARGRRALLVGQRAVAQAAAARERLAVRVTEWPADRYADAATLTTDAASLGARSR